MNFLSIPQLKVMIQLSNDPMGVFYQRQLARLSKVSVGAANQALRNLSAAEFVTREKMGKVYLYRLNLRNPVVRQFKVLLNVSMLYALVRQVRGHVRRIILFGSAAEGMDTRESDIDLFVLTDEREYSRTAISRFNRGHVRRIVPIILGANEFARLRRDDRPLHERVERGIVLWETG